MTLKIAALASGRGTNVAAIAKAIDDGKLDAELSLVLSNNPEAGVLAFARNQGIPVWAKSHVGIAREAFDTELIAAIKNAGADTIVLAGYMRLISPLFVAAFPGRVLNIHPALLPSFPGVRGGADAVAYGVKVSGVTVHFVDEIMDNGPVIIQGVVPVAAGDTPDDLMARIHALEHKVYPQALQWLAEGRLQVEGRCVRLLPTVKASSGAKMALASVGNQTSPWLVSPALEIF